MDSVSRARSMDEVYETALSCLKRVLQVDRSSVLLLDDLSVMRFAFWKGLSDAYRQAVEGHSPWSPAEASPGPITVPDVTRAASLAQYREILQREGISALAFIPLHHGGKLLGQFMLYYREPHEFSDQEVSLASAIAGLVGFAVAHMRTVLHLEGARDELEQRWFVEREARDRAERSGGRLARLQRLTAALSGALTPDKVHETLLTTGVEAVGAQAGMVYVISTDGAVLEQARVDGYPPGKAEVFARVPLDTRLPVTDAYRRRAPILIESPQQFREHYPDCACAVTPTWSAAFVCLPLLSSNLCLGVCVFSFVQPRPFARAEQAFLLAMAGQVALAIERARVYEQAQKALRAREDLLAIVSHELRTPLSIISMTAAVMTCTTPDGQPLQDPRTSAELIMRSAEQLERLIRDMQDFSQIETETLTIAPERQRIIDLLRDAVDAARLRAGRRGLELQVPADLAPEVVCDRGRVLQILDNLIGNAVKFTPEDGRIEVRLEVRDDEVIVAIEDTGVGIPREALPRVFARYWQARPREPRDTRQGVGLGLFIASGLVKAHGGTIWAESEPGEGSTFFFSLPLAGADERAAPPRRRILIVDDDAAFRREVIEVLESRGYEATGAANGREALRYLTAHPPPALTLLDLMMPVMDGWELLTAMRTHPVLASIPVVIVSCVDRARADSSLLQAAGYLEKPVSLQQLVDIVRQHCSR